MERPFNTGPPIQANMKRLTPQHQPNNQHNYQFQPIPNDIEHLKLLLKEEIAKNQSHQHQFSLLEEELESEKSRFLIVSNELQTLKHKKHQAENDLAQSTLEYMNAQAKLMEQLDSLNLEVQNLKLKLREKSDLNAKISEQNEELANKYKQAEQKYLEEHAKRVRPDNIQTNVNQIRQVQNEVLLNELKECHSKYKKEIEELTQVNQRLLTENENFQVLLIEKTVDGCFEGETLASELGVNDNVELNKHKFEIRSLQNHNKALKTSLERLVDRMLNDQTLQMCVEESLSKPKVEKFRNRVCSYTQTSIKDLQISGLETILPDTGVQTPKSQRSLSPASQRSVKFQSPKHWSKMIINSQFTGNPNRRAFSLGVDEVPNEGLNIDVKKVRGRE